MSHLQRNTGRNNYREESIHSWIANTVQKCFALAQFFSPPSCSPTSYCAVCYKDCDSHCGKVNDQKGFSKSRKMKEDGQIMD